MCSTSGPGDSRGNFGRFGLLCRRFLCPSLRGQLKVPLIGLGIEVASSPLEGRRLLAAAHRVANRVASTAARRACILMRPLVGRQWEPGPLVKHVSSALLGIGKSPHRFSFDHLRRCSVRPSCRGSESCNLAARGGSSPVSLSLAGVGQRVPKSGVPDRRTSLAGFGFPERGFRRRSGATGALRCGGARSPEPIRPTGAVGGPDRLGTAAPQ